MKWEEEKKKTARCSSSVRWPCRKRLAGQREGGWRSEGHGRQAEERPGRRAERNHWKGDAVLCSQSRPSFLIAQNFFFFTDLFIYCIRGHVLGLFFILNTETDVIPGDSAERCTSCQRRGSKTQDQDENLSEVCCCLFIFLAVQNVIPFNKK